MAMVKCVECGRRISDHAKFCPECGATMEYILSELEKQPQAESSDDASADSKASGDSSSYITTSYSTAQEKERKTQGFVFLLLAAAAALAYLSYYGFYWFEALDLASKINTPKLLWETVSTADAAPHFACAAAAFLLNLIGLLASLPVFAFLSIVLYGAAAYLLQANALFLAPSIALALIGWFRLRRSIKK